MFLTTAYSGGTHSRDVSGLIVRLERTSCLGTCPDYQVTIFGNGTVVYEGRHFVLVKGNRTRNISAEKVRQVLDKIFAIGYFSMKDEYTNGPTDFPTTFTYVSMKGREKRIEDYYDAPKRLHELEDMIDQVSGVREWVDCRPTTGRACDY
jgi:hypothetical protein